MVIPSMSIDGDAFGGAAEFLDGSIQRELPLFREDLLYIRV